MVIINAVSSRDDPDVLIRVFQCRNKPYVHISQYSHALSHMLFVPLTVQWNYD